MFSNVEIKLDYNWIMCKRWKPNMWLHDPKINCSDQYLWLYFRIQYFSLEPSASTLTHLITTVMEKYGMLWSMLTWSLLYPGYQMNYTLTVLREDPTWGILLPQEDELILTLAGFEVVKSSTILSTSNRIPTRGQ